ncbi:MAG: UvrD-helicase domain-containing protein [bacterium]|nr:UvrD-helicase domain-containing protein [bacterium]
MTNGASSTSEFLDKDPIISRLQLNKEKKETIVAIVDSHATNTLVTARAGSGKSTLLRALVYTLVKKEGVEKNHILFLAFNKQVREDNIKKLEDVFGIQNFFGVHTFDSLAYQIIKKPGNPINVLMGQELVDAIANVIRKESSIIYRLKYWWYLRELDAEFTQEARGQTTFLKEDVKSFGEKSIANFLFEYGLDYEYEPVFDWLENQYRPDFLITQGNKKVIVEYFGMDSPAYLRQVQRKRNYWANTGYGFIEMWNHDFNGGSESFLSKFKEKLINSELNLQLLSPEEKAGRLFEKKTPKIAEEIEKFIGYAQAQCLTPEDVQSRLNDSTYTNQLTNKDKFFNEFAVTVYEKYIEHLKENRLYDFALLKKEASKIIRETNGECTMNLGEEKNVRITINKIKWVLIDEFQDFSPTFYQLISAIQETNESVRFVCVGDEWQAINGFAGSDTQYMTNYGDFFDRSQKVFLLTNFRCSQDIVTRSNNLMRETCGANAIACKSGGGTYFQAINQIGSKVPEEILSEYIEATRNNIVQFIRLYPGKHITILHRNNKILGISLDYFLNKVRYQQSWGDRVKISNIHQFKGNEDDIVIIINATGWNHPMMHPARSRQRLLGLTDEKIQSAERRLFYVAMTRAKEILCLITEYGNPSQYISDI